MGAIAPVTFQLYFVLCSVHAIRVPVEWNSDSAVPEKYSQDAEIVRVSKAPTSDASVPIPVEYFQYPAKKPQFAVDVASFHGVKNPEEHYKTYPVRPYTGIKPPELGKHKILHEENPVFQQYQEFTHNKNEGSITPPSSEYEVYHPYKAEEPALQEIYKDPVLEKIRNDIYNSQTRLQKYEKDAGEPDIQKDEYLESPEQTDRKKIPHRNIPVPYEIHRPQRRPIYYRPSPYSSRDHYLNHRFRHPWNQHNAKIRPLHYRPLKNHLQRLRQNHALKYDDEHNEYPQVPTYEQISEVPDGYDIYERGKAKYVALRNNVDESINNAVKENRPSIFQKLELQNNGDRTETQIADNDYEFVPIKNYAQVRKSETTKHLPKLAAFEDADSFDEIKNAPRLREAIKSTKAQTVYTEEGYEDAAYDHEGEEKHAAENEAHGGFLKEKEISGGKYKTPSESQKYEDAGGKEYRDQVLHGEKWKNNDKDNEEEEHEEDYSEDETEHSVEADVYDEIHGDRDKRANESGDKTPIESKKKDAQTENEDESENNDDTVERKKRENRFDNDNLSQENISSDKNTDDEVNKRESNFKVPLLNFNSTFLTADELLKKAKLKAFTANKDTNKKIDIKEKYPYYFKNLKNVHKDSPLRYAENLKFIPKKSWRGTEFYDSRTKILECPDVDEDVNPIPEKLNKNGHPDETNESEESDKVTSNRKADFSQLKKNRRLEGLGDKIDCFKAKFFGENPLDSPFFKEEIISNPEPVTAPNSPIFKLASKDPLISASNINNVFNISEKLKETVGVSTLIDELKKEQNNLQETLVKTDQELRSSLLPRNLSTNGQLSQQTNVYSGILENIKHNSRNPFIVEKLSQQLSRPLSTGSPSNINYTSYNNKEDFKNVSQSRRRKRAVPFIYEPYKIIKDGQFQESKKTTTTSNISPLIKQLQSSKVIDRVTKTSDDKEKPVKRNVGSRSYKDIGRNDRLKMTGKGDRDTTEASFVDISVDSRRGEPRYEVRVKNHKTQYAPVQNKKSMSVEDYVAQTNKTIKSQPVQKTTTIPQQTTTRTIRHTRPTTKPYFDVSQFLPKSTTNYVQKTSASNTVKNIVQNPEIIKPEADIVINGDDDEEEEDYEEYEDEVLTTTTTTTLKPSFRKRRRRTTTTTAAPEENEPDELPKLRLITRFNTTPAPRNAGKKVILTTEKPATKTFKEDIDPVSPKYREKKKKSENSTIVTDTKTYGDDSDEDMMRDEVDAMIGVKQDMDEYKPHYEREIESEKNKSPTSLESSEEDESDDNTSEEEDDEDDISGSDEVEDSNLSSYVETVPTTPDPTKETLIRTTEAPSSTTETRSAKLQIKPIIHKKKIEIHKELPVNKSLPHTTQFKEDFKEIEIIKELPPKPKLRERKPQKNIEALELYKDDKLAEEVNKLGAVEVFKENLDLEKGPKHGGNYRSAQLIELPEDTSTDYPSRGRNLKNPKDADTSQSKNEKLIKLTDPLLARRTNGRARNSGRSSRLVLEETETTPKRLHGGNLKSIEKNENISGSNKNAKLIELDESESDDELDDHMHGGNHNIYDSARSRGRGLHGGNYRNAKLTDDSTNEEDTILKEKAASNNQRIKSATLLSSFAQAVPHLTTTPPYILDPSKRMYYYVDARR